MLEGSEFAQPVHISFVYLEKIFNQGLQCALDQFAISTSKSEAMILPWEKVDCLSGSVERPRLKCRTSSILRSCSSMGGSWSMRTAGCSV